MNYDIGGLVSFLRRSSSTFHAVDAICEALRGEGFQELRESERWQITPGKSYFVTRNLASVIAFRIPRRGFAPVQVVASHSDSPTFRLKEHAELNTQGRYTLLDTERYGSMIMSTWMDRPLGVAGRVLVRTPHGFEPRLVRIDRDLVLIPNMSIHQNREVNDGFRLNPQVDMLPLWGDETASGGLMRAIAEAAGVPEGDIVGSDLYLYNRMEPSIWGPDGCYISAPRLDDLDCAYAALRALTSVQPGENIQLVCVLDSEEIGSGTRQGANSNFLDLTLHRIARSLGADEEEYAAALASSFLVSTDNAHALHPNHPEKFDAANRCVMNGGVVIKFSANQKYATDGVSRAIFSQICEKAGVPVQYFANRSDMPGGSTLGNISDSHVSIPTVDIGLAQLAMHSSYETAGTRDAAWMLQALTAYYETQIVALGDDEYELR